MAFRWWADDGPLLGLYGSYVLPLPTNKNVVRVGPPQTKHSGSASLDIMKNAGSF